MDKYYLAYEERYKKIHSKGMLWLSSNPTPELLIWINDYCIPKSEGIYEVGCGEGRDALYLSSIGYKITGIDASKSAIIKCRELAKERELDIKFETKEAISLQNDINCSFKWIYSIATLHMLVDDRDRYMFLKSLYSMLDPGGHLLLVSMGDGENERKSDTSAAFELQERNNNHSGELVKVAATSYRSVNWENHKKELEKVGFYIEKIMDTQNDEYGNCMTVYLTK